MARRCFLFGHSDAPDSILPLLEARMEAHYADHGVREFITGEYGRFDALAAEAGQRIKQRHPDVRLTLMTPYYRPEENRPLPRNYDELLLPDGLETVPMRLRIVRANRKMIECADTVICYVCRPGNACKLLEFAQRRQQNGRIIVDPLLENLPAAQYNECTRTHQRK